MKKDSFSKFILDKKYIVFSKFFALILAIFLSIHASLNIEELSKQISFFFQGPELKSDFLTLNIFPIFLSSFIIVTLIFFLARVTIGVIFYQSQLFTQRIISSLFALLTIGLMYVNTLSKLNHPYSMTSISGSMVEFCLNFILASPLFTIFYYIARFSKSSRSKNIRFLVFICFFVLYLFYDFESLHYKKEILKENLSDQQIHNFVFITNGTDEKTYQSIIDSNLTNSINNHKKTQISQLISPSDQKLAFLASFVGESYPFENGIRNNFPEQTSLENFANFVKEKIANNISLHTTNISSPSNVAKILEFFPNGEKCSLDEKSIVEYAAAPYYFLLNSIVPNHLLYKFSPKQFCIYKTERIKELIYFEFMNAIEALKSKQTNLVSIWWLDTEKLKEESLYTLFENIIYYIEFLDLNNARITFINYNESKEKISVALLSPSFVQQSTEKIIDIQNVSELLFKNKFEEKFATYREERGDLEQKIPKFPDTEINNMEYLSFYKKRIALCFTTEGDTVKQVSTELKPSSQKLPFDVTFKKIDAIKNFSNKSIFQNNNCNEKSLEIIKNSFKNDIDLNISSDIYKLFYQKLISQGQQ